LPDTSRGARCSRLGCAWGAGLGDSESLEFCWGIASEGTPLEGSKLVVNLLPVVIHCVPCARMPSWRGPELPLPRCGEPCSDMRQGRELEIDSIEIEDGEEKL